MYICVINLSTDFMTPKDRRLIISVCLVLLNPAIWAIYKLVRVIKRCFIKYDEDGYKIPKDSN